MILYNTNTNVNIIHSFFIPKSFFDSFPGIPYSVSFLIPFLRFIIQAGILSYFFCKNFIFFDIACCSSHHAYVACFHTVMSSHCKWWVDCWQRCIANWSICLLFILKTCARGNKKNKRNSLNFNKAVPLWCGDNPKRIYQTVLIYSLW